MKKESKIILYTVLLLALIFIVLPVVLYFGHYTGYILLAIPFGIGLLSAMLMALHGPVSGKRTLKLSTVPILLVIVSCFAIAGEGAICMIIIGIVLLLPYYFGIVCGCLIQQSIWIKNTLLVLTLLMISTSATLLPQYGENKVVQDEMVVNVSQNQLWQCLTDTFSFGESENYFFKNGVSYPKSMHLGQTKDKKYLVCDYNNGKIAAEVTEFKEGHFFTFTFNDSLVSMREKNIYRETQTMHLQNHFSINYGKFEIKPIDANHCRLIASTNYRHKFEPEFYTEFWVNYFVHNLHQHVLTAVKTKSEAVKL